MNWDRRTFVKFAVGGVLGFASSPFIPKLQDDTAIWTQNWNWVPVVENGELAFANTVNPETGTAVRARIIKGRLEGERLIKVEGNPEHPLCAGGIIPADASAPQQLYNGLMRVESPMARQSRTGLRRPVSAEKAVEVLAGKLGELKKAGKANTVAVLADDPMSISSEMLMRLLAAYGSKNLLFPPSAGQNLALAGGMLFGQPNLGFDLMNSDCVISFGTPLLEGFGNPVAVRKAFVAWQDKGAGFIQVEPRASVTSGKAKVWVPCKPGNEGLVALMLAAALLESNSGNLSQVPWGDAFKQMLGGFTDLEAMAKKAGAPVKKVKLAAKALASAKRPLAVCGPGPAGDPGCLEDYIAVLALNTLLGNLGKEGGLVICKKPALKPLGDPVPVPDAATLPGAGTPLYNLQAFAEAAVKGDDTQLGALIVVNENPVFSGPQAELMRRLCDKAPLLVCISTYMDETASMADIVLPKASFLESWGDCASSYGAAQASYGIHRPLVTANAQSKSSGDWILALAKAMGGAEAEALAFESTEEALQARAAELGDFEELAAKSWWVQDKPLYEFSIDEPAMGSAREMLPSGGEILKERKGHPAVAGREKAHEMVMAPIPSLRTGAGDDPMSPYMMKILDKTTLAHTDQLMVEMNPATAGHLHLANGDMVAITSKTGTIHARVNLFEGAAPGMVFVPVGLGHTAFGMYLKGKGENFFAAAQASSDPLSGLPLWGLTPVTVHKGEGVSHG